MGIRAYLSIVRPVNSIVAGGAGLLGYLVASGTITIPSLILVAIISSITAAGNVLNDYFDVDIDAINRPERPIPSGDISKTSALLYASILFIIGNTLALFSNTLCTSIAFLNSFLLVAYARYVKKSPFFGNFFVSYLTGSIFIFSGAFLGISGIVRNMPLILITFLATFARELLKDAEDVHGDATMGAKTAPILIGIRKTTFLALLFAGCAVVVSLFPPPIWYRGPYFVGIGFVDIVILIGATRAIRCDTADCIKGSKATTILKIGMYLALLVYCLVSIL